MPATDTLRGRFAPSPTGDLHLGNARTALLAWLQARAAGGRFVLRMEDLDTGRVRPHFLQTQLRDLRWLGLDWDEGPDVGGDFGPYSQSARLAGYEAALAQLDSGGLVYDCFCSRREIAVAASAPHVDEEGPAYPGTCSEKSRGAIRRSGAHAALRFRVPDDEVEVVDLLQGTRRFRPAVETGDFVIRRKDGVAAYQLAVVVDDDAMAISDVLRGADLLASTARQILLYRALDLPQPSWCHVPLLRGPDGERLSKRHAALSLRELREGGTTPQRVVGWLAATCGLARPSTESSPPDLVGGFEIARLPREDTIVDLPGWLTRPSDGRGFQPAAT